MSHATFMIGDVFDRMAELPDNSVDLVLTSPPFLALRSYLPEDHPNKAKEIGSEPNPAEFVDVLLALSAEWRRVLAPHGSIAIELGDSFSGSSASGTDEKGNDRYPNGRVARGNTAASLPMKNGNGWPLPKSLALVPEAYRFALAYGHNPHTGTESPAGQWRVRNVIRWVRPNPPVGALGDKFRPATSEMVVATIASDRFFDLDAVREPGNAYDRAPSSRTDNSKGQMVGGVVRTDARRFSVDIGAANPAGAPPLDWWKITPKGYAGAHYAVWPAELCIKPIKAMCPEKVCRECGEPSRRVVRSDNELTKREIGSYLRARREDAGLSVREVAEHFPSASGGVTGCVWNWENTANTPTPEQWDTLRQLLDLDGRFDDVIYGDRSLVEYEHVSDHPSGTTQDATGRIYNRLPARKDRIAPDQFTDCGHNNYRPGIVLDPFAGTGTTLAVATGHGRDAIGIDIDERNALLAEERIGPMFLTIEGAT